MALQKLAVQTTTITKTMVPGGGRVGECPACFPATTQAVLHLFGEVIDAWSQGGLPLALHFPGSAACTFILFRARWCQESTLHSEICFMFGALQANAGSFGFLALLVCFFFFRKYTFSDAIVIFS